MDKQVLSWRRNWKRTCWRWNLSRILINRYYPGLGTGASMDKEVLTWRGNWNRTWKNRY